MELDNLASDADNAVCKKSMQTAMYVYINIIKYMSLESSNKKTSHQVTSTASNALFDDIVTNVDDCVTIIDNQCYEPVDSYPQYKEESSDTWQIIVVEEVRLMKALNQTHWPLATVRLVS